jgi:uncharacterized protein (TIGR02145 family)
MKKIILLISLSLVFTQELKVEGNLNVTGAVINDSLTTLIDSLQTQINAQQTLIEQLQAQIILLGQQLGLVDCNGDFGGDAIEDFCGVCDSDASNDCLQDCAGNWGGDVTEDACGVCGGDAVSEDECYYPCLDFECTSIIDIDGNTYQTIQIGEQLWMQENLKVTHYSNGDAIPNITNNGDWGSLSTGAYGDYDNNPSNSDTYGRLYNWYTVDDSRGACPEGWHMPSDEEFLALEMFLGMSESEANSTDWRGTNEGSKLAGNAELWDSGDLEQNSAFGSSGFNALPAGYRNQGNYISLQHQSYFWSSSETGWSRVMDSSRSDVLRFTVGNQSGYSVRCIRD